MDFRESWRYYAEKSIILIAIMSVFTQKSPEQIKQFLTQYDLGEITDIQPTQGGVTNSNWYISNNKNTYILTLFEHCDPSEINYYLGYTDFLADNNLPAPRTVLTNQKDYFCLFDEKPAALVQCLNGQSIKLSLPSHCQQMGDLLAQIHNLKFKTKKPNLRDLLWCEKMAVDINNFLNNQQKDLLYTELDFQKNLDFTQCTKSTIHADLFRDNVLFENNCISGIFDFYYACYDYCIYDLAVVINDWCFDSELNFSEENYISLVNTYEKTRPLNQTEKQLIPNMCRRTALRFWLSRLQESNLMNLKAYTSLGAPEKFVNILSFWKKYDS